MKIKPIFIATFFAMPISAMAGPCQTLWPEHNCQQWDSELEAAPSRTCVCMSCPSGSTMHNTDKNKTLNGFRYNLDAGCAVLCNCENNPDSTKRGGGCDFSPADITKPDYSTCITTPTGAKLCNTTTNKCNGRSLTIGGQIYCEFTGSTCGIPAAESSMLVSKYCVGGAGNPSGGLQCKAITCKENATVSAKYDSCLCNRGYYMDTKTFICHKCESEGGVPGTTTTNGATDISQCYIPANTDMKDSTGTSHFIEPCSYTK